MTVDDVIKSLPAEYQKVIRQTIEQSKTQEYGWVFLHY